MGGLHFRNIADLDDITITIEMHKSMWCEDFKNWQCRDLCVDGTLYNNPDLLNCSDEIKDKIRRGSYNVYPVNPLYYSKSYLSDYIYVSDTPHGMRIIIDARQKEDVIPTNKIKSNRYFK
jgi:hypothetical protein